MKIRSIKPINLSVAFVGLILMTIEANAMAGIFGSKTLFSELTGTVVIGGEPCVGARLVQTVSDGGGEKINAETTTDTDGKFDFSDISKKKGFLSLLPGEFVAAQQILIHYEGREYQGWISSKRSPEPNAESDGNPFELVCDLDQDPQYSENHFGVCRLVESASTK